jgi:hypothetical protein
MKRFPAYSILCLALFLIGIQLNAPLSAQDDLYIRADRLGITHISSSTVETPPDRYRQALTLGAGWNRYPIYWNEVQPEPDTWFWENYDRQVRADLANGLKINAILLGRPQFYADGNRIQGMNEPIFADGSDTPGPAKELNPENHWVRYVHEVVTRYMPNGELAREGGLPGGRGIEVWEVWNEPDFTPFWQASIMDYARLLKSSYIVIKMLDPDAQVMFGGLLYPSDVNWLAQVLNIYVNDPFHEQYHWYMDIVAVHSYTDPWRSGWLTLVARQTMIEYGIDRPIWLNETGVPVWDDYPGPIWDSTSSGRATTQQQGWYFIQSAAYAWSEGADKVFFHQLYDDCGDQPAGTNFPPHSGELCTGDFVCAGDAHGIFRNTSDSICFSQHPLGGTPRPVAKAYRLVAEIFGSQPFDSGKRVYGDDQFLTLTFERPLTNQRITVMWNQTFSAATLAWEAVGDNGQLLWMSGDEIITPDDEGLYHIDLPAAQPDNYPDAAPGASAIGGEPYILIEQITGEIEPESVDLAGLDSQSVVITPRATSPPPRPTVDPANDSRPPLASVNALPEISEPTFTVSWHGEDDSGIKSFLVWARVDGGDWRPWLETSATSAEYTGTPGGVYEFAVWAVDLADNWSTNTDLQPQGNTRVE